MPFPYPNDTKVPNYFEKKQYKSTGNIENKPKRNFINIMTTKKPNKQVYLCQVYYFRSRSRHFASVASKRIQVEWRCNIRCFLFVLLLSAQVFANDIRGYFIWNDEWVHELQMQYSSDEKCYDECLVFLFGFARTKGSQSHLHIRIEIE